MQPEPETQPEPNEGVPPEDALLRTRTLGVAEYEGEEVTTMYHGTDSWSAQLIACSQEFRPSEDGLLGKGVYVTRSRQKAEGYRIHHPNAALVGSRVRNVPLLSGEPDLGCILQMRVRLGACKELSRTDEEEALECWHDEEVPELSQTMRDAAEAAGVERVTYNSAYSAGCPCCETHGTECPGCPENGHNVPPGVDPCQGRCRTGWRRCPRANSCFEEYCIYNPARIDRIEIVDGPRPLIGLGREFWTAEQSARDAAVRSKNAWRHAWDERQRQCAGGLTTFTVAGDNRHQGTDVVVKAMQVLGEQAAAQGVADWWSGVTADSVQTELARLHGQGEFGAAEYTDGRVGVRIWNLTDSDIHCCGVGADGLLSTSVLDVPAAPPGRQPRHAAAMCHKGRGWSWKLFAAPPGGEMTEFTDYHITECNAQHVFVCQKPVLPVQHFCVAGDNRHQGTDVVVKAMQALREQADAQGVADWWSGVTADSVQAELARLHGQGEFGAAEYTDGQVGVRIWNLTDSDIRCRWEDTDGSLTDTSIDVTASDRGAQPKHAAAMCAAGAGKWKIYVDQSDVADMEYAVGSGNAQHVFVYNVHSDKREVSAGEILYHATMEGRLDEVRALLDQGAPVHFADVKGDQALHHAAIRGHNEIIDLLVARGADVNARNGYGRTPLIYAAYYGHASTCSQLLSLGADRTLTNAAGLTALDGARRAGRAECVAILQ